MSAMRSGCSWPVAFKNSDERNQQIAAIRRGTAGMPFPASGEPAVHVYCATIGFARIVHTVVVRQELAWAMREMQETAVRS